MVSQKLTYNKETGELLSFHEYNNGVLVLAEVYHSNGNISYLRNKYVEVSYDENGKLHGVYKKFYDDNEIPYILSTYNHGQRHGKHVKYNLDGTIDIESNYLNDLKNGLEKSYYKNNQLCFESQFLNGKRNGYHKTYLPSGHLKKIEFYINEKLI